MAVVSVLGVRHHGPGSARAVAEALSQLDPDAVVIEGAPELDRVLGLIGSPGMAPPVAGLVYGTDHPRRAAFYPLAAFSPEWVALRWAHAAGRPARFCDLPAANVLALGADPGTGEVAVPPAVRLGDDPIATLAAAAGYDDPERWWEDVIEHRYHGVEVFAAIAEAMAELRTAEAADAPLTDGLPEAHNQRREAAMRKVLRATVKAGAERVAVICGAWHAPALDPSAWPSLASDHARLRRLPRIKVEATWVPWTSARLARRSGYGAGVSSPGWYHHLFTAPDAAPTRFLVRAARLLRDQGLDVSPAATVEAVRLADGLALLRGRPGPGLGEVMDAAEAALTGGSPVPLRLVADTLLVGHDLGSVPDDTPMVPLARDLARWQRRLRLPGQATPRTLELDLRNDTHRRRSQLLHRLALLGVDWGTPADMGRTGGTFREAWLLRWHPEFSVVLVEASALGTTIEEAATAGLAEAAAASDDAGELALLVESALLAELPGALAAVVEALAARAAEKRDTARLMVAVEPLARTRRYGNVRRVDTETIAPVLAGILTRVSIGLPAAVAAVDDDGAAHLRTLVDSVDRAVGLLDDPELRRPWLGALRAVADQRGVHGLLAGRAVRLLLDRGAVGTDDTRRRLSLTLSRPDEAPRAAAWLEGFLAGDSSLLLHDPGLLRVVDDWMTEVRAGVFEELLPVLRRTFAAFPPPDRRALGEHLRRLEQGGGPDESEAFDPDRGARVLPRLLELLGVSRVPVVR